MTCLDQGINMLDSICSFRLLRATPSYAYGVRVNFDVHIAPVWLVLT